ncbi:MAG: VWA domain-containing protein, partial [Candidatus Uhrbacteria bacterium]|nr:VWA domain-containing protein [Candidatus Uhrbacteria bacterium]
YSYDASSTSTLPNAATLTVPACSAATDLLVDVSYDDVEQSEVRLVFVTDTSGSMGYGFGATTDSDTSVDERLVVAQESIIEGMERLYDEVDSIKVALVEFNSGSLVYADTDGSWFDSTYQSDLEVEINSYNADYNATTSLGLLAAQTLLDDAETDSDNFRKIIILLSDSPPDAGYEPDNEVLDIIYDDPSSADVEGYEIYSIALSSVDSFIDDMNGWSSNSSIDGDCSTLCTTTAHDYNQDNHIDYSYDGTTSESLSDAYEEIVNSIIYGMAKLITIDDQGTSDTADDVTYFSAGILPEGEGIALPWPEGFTCDPDGETSIPIQIIFSGTGQVEITDPRVNYCAP